MLKITEKDGSFTIETTIFCAKFLIIESTFDAYHTLKYIDKVRGSLKILKQYHEFCVNDEDSMFFIFKRSDYTFALVEGDQKSSSLQIFNGKNAFNLLTGNYKTIKMVYDLIK